MLTIYCCIVMACHCQLYVVLFPGPGWRAEIRPQNHPLVDFDFDVVIGADGRRNTLDGEKNT